jgi:hypothetical protein
MQPLALALDLSLASRLPWAGTSILLPDLGYVFVFHADGRQLYHADGLAVQVPDSFANS